jgi:hypothetical protein
MIRALVIGILSTGAFAACSTTPSHPAPPSHLSAHRTATAYPPGWCSTSDGKMVKPGTVRCDAVRRTSSGDQLQGTGYTDAAHALQALDPSITANGP